MKIRLGTLLTIVMMVMELCAVADCLPAPSGLVGFWPGDGSANDLVSTNHGILTNGATANASGMVDNTFSFDGTNGFVKISDAAALKPTNLTIEAWVKLDAFGSTFNSIRSQYIVFKKNTRGGNFEGYALQEITNAPNHHVFHFLVTSANGSVAKVDSTTSLSTGVWYHVAGVRGTTNLQLYVNGTLEAQAIATNAQDYAAGEPLYFGTTGLTFDGKFRGQLDEVSLYNRALSATEISDIYAAAVDGKCKAPQIIFGPYHQPLYVGSNATFSIAAKGFSPLAYRWRRFGTNLNNSSHIGGVTNTDLTITNAQPADAGNYTVVVTNMVGVVTSTVAVLAVPPSNDNFENAIIITGNSNRLTASNIGGTLEFNERPAGCCYPTGYSPTLFAGASLWWVFTPTNAGVVELDRRGSAIDVLMAVYEGGNHPTNIFGSGPLTHNFQVHTNGYGTNVQQTLDRIRFDVHAGTAYHIEADGNGGRGNITLTVLFTSAAANNNFDARFTINPTNVAVAGTNIGADLETDLGEPTHFGSSPDHSVWWKWTPTQAGPVIITTFGSTFDTVLDVYTGTGYPLNLLANNANAYQFFNQGPTNDPASRVTIIPTPGTEYQIAVSGELTPQYDYYAHPESGFITLNFVKLGIEDIVSATRTELTNGTVNFTNTLRLRNWRPTVTNPLRIRLLARASFTCMKFLYENLDFLESLNVADEGLGIITLSTPSTITSSNFLDVVVSGNCPAPYQSSPGTGAAWGFGRGVIALLEEQVGPDWKTVDGRLITIGQWPSVGGFIGPGGGVVTISTLGSTYSNPGRLQVSVGPSAAVARGGAWRISPTNHGELKELWFYTNFVSKTLLFYVKSTNFTVELTNLVGFASPTNQTVAIRAGDSTNLNLLYSVAPPWLLYSTANGLGATGTVGTAYRIESATRLNSPTNWTLFDSSITLTSGTNWIPGTLLNGVSNRFYRALWLQD